MSCKIPVAATHYIAQWTDENGAYTESKPTGIFTDSGGTIGVTASSPALNKTEATHFASVLRG